MPWISDYIIASSVKKGSRQHSEGSFCSSFVNAKARVGGTSSDHDGREDKNVAGTDRVHRFGFELRPC
eukprot:scaffold20829_cov76-Skeletonema_dohrnii-CCMP3373.AAC.3